MAVPHHALSRRQWGLPYLYLSVSILRPPNYRRAAERRFIASDQLTSSPYQRHYMLSFILMWHVSIIRGPIKEGRGGEKKRSLVHLSSVKGWAGHGGSNQRAPCLLLVRAILTGIEAPNSSQCVCVCFCTCWCIFSRGLLEFQISGLCRSMQSRY